VTFRISLDSSILISQLTGDVHAEAVLAALMVLETMGAELTVPLLCYAELWTGVELLPEADRPAAAETFGAPGVIAGKCTVSVLSPSPQHHMSETIAPPSGLMRPW
jgi:hypothetical protein